MEITLEKIELVKDRTGVTYAEAKEALEKTDGNVVDAIIEIEDETDRETGPARVTRRGSLLLDKCVEIIRRGNVSKIVVKHEGEQIVNLPVNAGLFGVVIAPWGVLAAALAAFGLNCTVQIIRNDGSILDVSDRAEDFVEGAKTKGAQFYEDAKTKGAQFYEDAKTKGAGFYEDAKSRGARLHENLRSGRGEGPGSSDVKENLKRTAENVKKTAPDVYESVKEKAEAAGMLFGKKMRFGKKDPGEIDMDELRGQGERVAEKSEAVEPENEGQNRNAFDGKYSGADASEDGPAVSGESLRGAEADSIDGSRVKSAASDIASHQSSEEGESR